MVSDSRNGVDRVGDAGVVARAARLLDVRPRWRQQTVATQLMLLSVGVTLSMALVGNAVTTLSRDRTSARVFRRDALRRAEVAGARLSTRLTEAVGADSMELAARRVLRPRQVSVAAAALAAAADSVRVVAGAAGFSGLDARVSELRAIAAGWARDPSGVTHASVDRARTIERQVGGRLRAGVERDIRRVERERLNDARLETALRLAILLALLLLTWAIGRAMSRTLGRVIRLAEALSTGQYPAPGEQSPAPNLELGRLVDSFDRLALSIAEREQILRSDILQLKEVEQLKNDFVSTVSHELRTPLTSMRGALGLLLAGAAGSIDDKARQLTQIAYQNTERLVRLINDILDIEKIEAGHVTVRRDACDLAGVLRSTVASLASFAQEAGVRVTLSLEEGATILGDDDRLVQLFTNLLSNALKFSPRGGEVRVRLTTQDFQAITRVEDQGPGIPPEFQARIFGKFQQAERPEARRSGGTGLGLAIAHAIAELHGGVIRFETAAGKGTSFIVELPLSAGGPRHAPAPSSGRPRILVVDSDASMLAVLETYFNAFGDVTSVRSAAAARDAATRTVFDAVVADPALPGEDGFDLVRQLRRLDAHHEVPVLLFSTREYSAEELRGVLLSPTHAFVKARDREQDLALRLRAVLAARGVGSSSRA